MDWGYGAYGKEKDGACLPLPEESGGRARRSVMRKNGRVHFPLGGETGKPPLRISTAPFFPGGGAMAGRLFFSLADKIGEGFVPAG